MPPIAEAIAAAQAELSRSNHYTEPYSAPLRRLIAGQLSVPERLIHINAGSERALGAHTFYSEAYFFLADFAPHDAAVLARRLAEQKILIKPLNDPRLGPGYMRVTAALPEDNARFVEAPQKLL